MILDRFGKEHHEILIRQLFRIKQLTSVAEYIERFSALVDQLTAYETKADPLYFSMRFIDVFKGELRSAVLMQRPADLDTTCVLALLQEEVADLDKKREFRKLEYASSVHSPVKMPLPLPFPPRPDKLITPSIGDDQHVGESSRSRPPDDRMATLRAYRRARAFVLSVQKKMAP